MNILALKLALAKIFRFYSNHLNTKDLKLDTFCPVYKWSDHKIRQTIQTPDIFYHKSDIFCLVFRPPFKNWTI